MNAVIYIEVESQEQLDRYWQEMEANVEAHWIDGFFTLTVDGRDACPRIEHRPDLIHLSGVIERAQRRIHAADSLRALIADMDDREELSEDDLHTLRTVHACLSTIERSEP